MARKPSEGKAGKAGGAPVDRPARAEADSIFGDKRSGGDRRTDHSVSPADPRRSNAERRRTGRTSKTAWWLERDYVESHHFLQKSSASGGRTRRRDEEKAED